MTTWRRVWTLRIHAVLVVASIVLAGCSTPEDLFACNLPLSCPEMFGDWNEPGAVECAGSKVASGKPHVLLATADPCPGNYEAQFLVILRGDGTAVLQIRERECDEDCTETLTEQWKCNVVFPSNTPTCELDGDLCGWWLWDFDLTNCTSIDPELSCSDAKAIAQ